MKYKIYLFIKSMFITIVFIMFLFLMFLVYNRGNKKIYGRALSLDIQNSSLYIKDRQNQWTIKPDINKTAEVLKFIYSHPAILPAPLYFIQMAEHFSYILNRVLNLNEVEGK